ncbi:hypothetical protein [Buttiauxella gaviniae]
MLREIQDLSRVLLPCNISAGRRA